MQRNSNALWKYTKAAMSIDNVCNSKNHENNQTKATTTINSYHISKYTPNLPQEMHVKRNYFGTPIEQN